MQHNVVHNSLTQDEIAGLLNNHTVSLNRQKLQVSNKVYFTIDLSETLREKIESIFSIDLGNLTSLPMRWIKGDTESHIDKGETQFDKTHLIYLTNAPGNLVINNQSYPIVAGDAHVFSEGLEHSTVSNGDSERLLIGPMSEFGFSVGYISLNVYYYYSDNPGGYVYVHDPTPQNTVKFYDYIPNLGPIPPNKIFGGWKIRSSSSPNSLSEVLNGVNNNDILNTTNTYYIKTSGEIHLIPEWIDAPASNICFISDTPITTDQGDIAIDKLIPGVNTINGKPIVDISKTTSIDNKLVCFEKDALGPNLPNKKTVMSIHHKVYYNGNLVKAMKFVEHFENVNFIEYNNEILYNVLMDDYTVMPVNGLICETLHPNHIIVKLFTKGSKYSPQMQVKLRNMLNTCVKKNDYEMYAKLTRQIMV